MFFKQRETNRKNLNFCEYQFKGNYNRCCNFPNPTSRTSLNNNIKLNGRGIGAMCDGELAMKLNNVITKKLI